MPLLRFGRMAALAILLFSAAAQGEMIRLVPSSSDVLLGSSFNVDVLADHLNLGGFDLVLGFSPALVGFSGVSPDGFLGDSSVFEALFDVTPDLDSIRISEVSFLDPAALLSLQGDRAANSFRLATLTFQAGAVGLSEFGFDSIFLTDLQGNEISAAFSGASVLIREGATPQPVPEPSTWMLLSVAGVLLLLRRRASLHLPGER